MSDVVKIDLSRLASRRSAPDYADGWTKGFERGFRHGHATRVWQIFGALACVVNAYLAGRRADHDILPVVPGWDSVNVHPKGLL